jgi:integrase
LCLDSWDEIGPQICATFLRANGEDVKVVLESLRHANSRTTLDTYTQAATPAKRQAQSKVVRMIVPKESESGAEMRA